MAQVTEGDGEGGADGASDGEGEGGAQAQAEPASFPLDYVRELRAENKGWRLKAAEMEAAAGRAREDLAAAREAAAARIVLAEVKAAAARAGMVDPDGVRLLDLSAVRLSENGEVEGAEAAVEAARKSRPWLFADARTSNPAAPPRPRDAREGRDARQMAPKEYEAARKRQAWRR